MTDRRLDVYLDGRLSGRLTQSPAGDLTFTYDDAYRDTPDVTPLSLSMPTAADTHRKRVVLPFLQGLLPDSAAALSAMGRRYGVSPHNPFALLEHIGADAAGAVQIMPADQPAPDAVRSRRLVRSVDENEVSTMLTHVVEEYTDGAPHDDAMGRFSLAGAQPKIALHLLDDGSWGVPEDATPTTHILKPVVGTFRRIDVVEQLTMRAASALGLDVASSELVRIGSWDVFVTRRYDRAYDGTTWRRLHQEDLCQALSVAPDKKYQHLHGGPGVAAIGQLLRSLPVVADRSHAGLAFYRALLFQIVCACTDAHAKNFSLMLEGRSVRLAPLYDLLTYSGYWDGKSRLDSAMSIAKVYALKRITPADLVATGALFGVSRHEAMELVEAARRGSYAAFESAREELLTRGPDVTVVADGVLAGLRQLPLIIT